MEALARESYWDIVSQSQDSKALKQIKVTRFTFIVLGLSTNYWRTISYSIEANYTTTKTSQQIKMANLEDHEDLAAGLNADGDHQPGLWEQAQRPLYITTTSELLRTGGVIYTYLGQTPVICIGLTNHQLTPTQLSMVNSMSAKEGVQMHQYFYLLATLTEAEREFYNGREHRLIRMLTCISWWKMYKEVKGTCTSTTLHLQTNLEWKPGRTE